VFKLKIFSAQDLKSNNKYSNIVDKYMFGKEVPMISIEVEYNGEAYREIAFFKKNVVGKPSKRINGIVFVDKNFEIVNDKRLQKELFSAFFNLTKLFEENFINNLSKALASEADLEKDQEETDLIGEILLELSDRRIEGADRVRDIVLKLPQLKRENNQAIQRFIEATKENQNGKITYDDIICKIKPLYLETLMKNFEKIKLIGSCSGYYSGVKKEAMKNYKKGLLSAMGSSTNREGMMIEAKFSHMIKVNQVYSSILEFSNSEYIKYLNDKEKLQIDELIEKNRVNKVIEIK
jgi:hypothetical protein